MVRLRKTSLAVRIASYSSILDGKMRRKRSSCPKNSGGASREFFPQLERFLRIFPSKIDEYEAILTSNEVFKNRTIGVGMIPPEVARAYSVTGPIARASGIDYDVRRAEPYSIYDRFDWDVPTRFIGDCFDRYLIRIQEMRQSTRILQQALEAIPEGDIRAKMP